MELIEINTLTDLPTFARVVTDSPRRAGDWFQPGVGWLRLIQEGE